LCVCVSVCILNKTKNVKKVENKKSELEKKNSVDDAQRALPLRSVRSARRNLRAAHRQKHRD